MKARERNEKVLVILNELYEKACNNDIVIDEAPYADSMDMLFNTTSWGFREIVLVIVVATLLDENYRASTGLYECKPRGIYEHPIKEFLIDKHIPHRKSGPLNIAKAIKGLDDFWASQREPREVANEVLNIVRYLEQNPSKEKTNQIGISLLRRLIKETERVETLNVEIEPTEDPEKLFFLCKELIRKTPDAGNTPQKIAAFLLKNYHLAMDTGIIVTGEDDRASVTSTTSDKPGDVNEESSDGIIFKVYEITVKHFGLARIRDSYDCVKKYNDTHGTSINEIIVICRTEDCPSDIELSGLKTYLGHYEYQDIIYYYWDIFEWVAVTLQRMTGEARSAFYHDLNSYISDINTAESVKELWKDLHD